MFALTFWAGIARRLDHRNDLRHRTPALLADDLEVKNFNREIRFTSDAQCLLDRLPLQ